jgi:fructose-bisphosphate aldolase class II
MQVSIRKLFKEAYKNYGVGAFNVFNAEQVNGVFRGAQLCRVPVILQITPVARKYMGSYVLSSIIEAVSALYPDVAYSVHLDHGNYEHCIDAINSGKYNSVMIDASHESYDENIRITRKVVKAAHARNVSVEAELGVLSGVEDDIAVAEEFALFTNPDQAKDFVEKTACDSLAVAVGTSHGAYKFSGGKGLQTAVLSRISELLPGFPLVLHGASAVSAKEVVRIKSNGGYLKTNASGLKDSELLAAIKLGVCKINIATDLRLLWARVHREFFTTYPELFDPVIPGKTYMDELEYFVAQKCQLLNSLNERAC